jgi:hypothetical protein
MSEASTPSLMIEDVQERIRQKAGDPDGENGRRT